MATSYGKVFEVFLRKISDFDLPSLSDEDLTAYCMSILTSALPKVKPLQSDFNDAGDDGFTDDLINEEVEILACQMVVEWIDGKLNTTQLLHMFAGTKDENMASQANHIKALIELKEKQRATVSTIIRDYGYRTMIAESEG